ncbi:MAG TPA: ATP-binding protein [Alphaproteobacteria bacterium]|nr:ATP-binding protein [Alphaproteobacteria bacterium]
MDLKQIQSLVTQNESHQLEFKKSTGLLRAVFETVCAFLNSDGGIVLIGVTNDGDIIGQELTDKIQQTISNEISKLEPPAKVIVNYVPLEKNNLFVIALQVKSGSHKPYVYEGRPFQREQTVTKRMSQQRYDQLIPHRLHNNFSWERTVATGYLVEDLDSNLLQSIVRKSVDVKRMPEDALQQDIPRLLDILELTTDGQLNNAAVVLFGKKMMPAYPQCQIQLARFKGLDRSEFLDIDLAYGNVFELLEKGMLFVRRHLPLAAKIEAGKLERVETPLIPFEAIREALLNAFCHRDYSIYGGSISLAIYDNRMEIFNHGGLPPGVSIEKIKAGFSQRRNPVIADVFYRSNLVEKWGRGIQKIISSCLAADDPEPEFFADEVEFKVTFQFPASLKPSVFIMDETENPYAHLTKKQQEIIKILSEDGALAARDILDKIKKPISQRTLRRELLALTRQGIVKAHGHTSLRIWSLTEDKKED